MFKKKPTSLYLFEMRLRLEKTKKDALANDFQHRLLKRSLSSFL